MSIAIDLAKTASGLEGSVNRVGDHQRYGSGERMSFELPRMPLQAPCAQAPCLLLFCPGVDLAMLP